MQNGLTKRLGATTNTHSLLLVFALLATITAELGAQQPRNPIDQRRGQFVEGVLQNLVDSSRALDPRFSQPQQSPVTASRNVQQARNSIRQFTLEADQLIIALRHQERYTPYVRNLLGDALRVKATAELLMNRANYIANVSELANEYSTLDQQWRLLGYQLQQSADLGNSVMQRVQRLNQINEDLETRLKLSPQMDTGQLVYFYSALSEALVQLSEDVRIDLYSHPKRDQFRRELSQLRSQSQQLRLAVESNYPYADISRYYKRFHNEWLALKGELRVVDNRYVQRNISRVTQINERIYELLWLPPVIDGRDILFQAEALQSHIDKVAGNVSMAQLIKLPNSTDMFNRCKEFYNMCGDFRNTVATETQLDNVRWDFRVLDVAWHDLKSEMGPIETPELIQDIDLIDNRVHELRHSLGLQAETFDYSAAGELASQLRNISDLLNYDITRNLGRSIQFPAQLRNQAVRLAGEFNQSTKTLYDRVASQVDAQSMKQISQRLVQQWQELQGYIAQVPANQRYELARTSQEIATLMAKLQVMYGS